MEQWPSYFITGGYGLIGSSLVNKIKGKVTILTKTEKNKKRITRDDATILLKDLSEIEKKDIENVDVIYHCASTVDNYNVLTDPYIDVETNIKGTIRLLEVCKDLVKKPKIIFLSTFFVYGNEYDKTHTPINEEAKTDPLALYPATKLFAESTIKLYSKLYNIPYIICRLTNVYSEYEDYTNMKKGAFNYLIMKAVKGEAISLYNDGNFYRDYIHLDDVITAILLLEKKATNDSFLVGYGKPILFKDMITYLLNLTNNKSKIKIVEPPPFHKIVGINNFVANIDKIRGLGFEPTVHYKTGIKRIVEKYSTL